MLRNLWVASLAPYYEECELSHQTQHTTWPSRNPTWATESQLARPCAPKASNTSTSSAMVILTGYNISHHHNHNNHNHNNNNNNNDDVISIPSISDANSKPPCLPSKLSCERSCEEAVERGYFQYEWYSPKLIACPWKMDGWETILFLFGMVPSQNMLVLGRVSMSQQWFRHYLNTPYVHVYACVFHGALAFATPVFLWSKTNRIPQGQKNNGSCEVSVLPPKTRSLILLMEESCTSW